MNPANKNAILILNGSFPVKKRERGRERERERERETLDKLFDLAQIYSVLA